MVDKVTSQELKQLLNDESRLTVIDFYADWCQPCRFSSPAFAKMSENYDENIIEFV